jgi:hypothetical protein
VRVLLGAVLWLIYHYLSSVIQTLPVVAPEALRAVVEAARAGEPVRFLVHLLTAFFLIAFPATAFIGLALYLQRLSVICLRWARARAGGKKAAGA